MQPKVLIVQTFYPEFLKDIYAAEPGLADLDFDAQCTRLFGSAFGTGDAYSHGLRALGCEAAEVICNADAAQAKWAEENGLRLASLPCSSPSPQPSPLKGEGDNIHDRRRQIIAAQIDDFRPDVLYVFEWCPLGDRFVAEMRSRAHLVVGEIASPLPPDRTFRGYDLMISSWPPIVEYFRGEGIASEHVRLGFDRRILDRLPRESPRYPVSFVGGFAPSHPDRIPWLEELLSEVEVDIFCYGLERTRPDSPIRRHYRGQAWGWSMYQTLQRSRITLNRHARLDVRGSVNTDWSNNMRLYEATGVGTCLLTEQRPHLHKLFEPDREVITYRDTAECIEKIGYYLAHEEERAAIARAGQQRTLREHLYTDRMGELLDIFRRYLNGIGRMENLNPERERWARTRDPAPALGVLTTSAEHVADRSEPGAGATEQSVPRP